MPNYLVAPYPLEYDITEERLSREVPPRRVIIPGNDYSLRLRLYDPDTVNAVTKPFGDALDLTGAVTIVMTVRPRLDQAEPVFTRTLGVAIVGSSPVRNQITLDAQGSITPSDVLQVPASGKGWFEVLFGRETADKDALTKITGTCYYDVQVQFADSSVKTVLQGRLTIKRQVR